MRQASNLECLLCKSKFMPVEEYLDVNCCRKNCVCCSYLLKTSSYLFKNVNKLIARAEKLFMLLLLKNLKVYWQNWLFDQGEDNCLQAAHKVATISTNKSGGTSSPLLL